MVTLRIAQGMARMKTMIRTLNGDSMLSLGKGAAGSGGGILALADGGLKAGRRRLAFK